MAPVVCVAPGVSLAAMLSLALALSLAASSLSAADGPAPGEPVTLRAAIEQAVTAFAEVRATRAELSAADHQVGLAKKKYLPDGDVYLQWNRATRNNIFGLLLPNGSVPGISGPVLEDTTSDSTYGSVAAALVRWDAVDFGYRAAGVREAEALRQRAEMGLRVTEIDVSVGTVETFLGVMAAESVVRAAAATVERMARFEEAVHVLATNELRAGADLSLARAELARARIELIRAERVRDDGRTRLAEWLSRPGETIAVDGDALIETVPSATAGHEDAAPASHPRVALAQAEIDAARAREAAAAKSALPRIQLLGSLYSRGTGALVDGTFAGGSEGLWPDTTNWALGLAVRFPFLDLPEARRARAVEESKTVAAQARHDYAVNHIAAEVERATLGLETALRIADFTPLELDAAQDLQTQARARYDAGLADALEVAESERILRRAETEDAMARLDVWRARFTLAAAQGDLGPLLSELD